MCFISFILFSSKIEWLKKCAKYDIIQRMKDGDSITSYKLCNLHFNEKMFTNSKKNRLKLNAIPTIFSKQLLLLSIN